MRIPCSIARTLLVVAALPAGCRPVGPQGPPGPARATSQDRPCPRANCAPVTPAGWELTDIVVAKTNLAPGTILSEDRISTDRIPRKFRRADMVIPKELDTVLGNEIVVPVQKGHPLSWHHLRGRYTAESQLSKAIPKRGRAYTIAVRERTAVGHLVRPADHVDVVAVTQDPRTRQPVARLLLQNIIVLATGPAQPQTPPQSRAPHQPYRTVTLLLLPEEVLALALAQRQGELSLALRNPTDLSLAKEATGAATPGAGPAPHLEKRRGKRDQTNQRIRTVRGLPGGKR